MREKLLALKTKVLKSELFRMSAIYTASMFLKSSVPFFLLPLLTRYMNPTQFGILAMFGVVQGVANVLVLVNTNSAVSVLYYHDEFRHRRSALISSSVIVVGVMTIVLAIVSWLAAPVLNEEFQIPLIWLQILPLFVSGVALNAISLTVLRIEKKALVYSIVNVGITAVDGLMAVWLVVGEKQGLDGRLMSMLVSSMVAGLVAFVMMYRSGLLKLGSDTLHSIKATLRYGIPLFPHSLSGFLDQVLDRVVLSRLTGLHEVGTYAVGAQIARVMDMLQNSFNHAWSPWLYERLAMRRDDINLKVVRISYALFAANFVVAAMFAVAAYYGTQYFVGPEFVGAKVIAFWIVLSYAFMGMYKVVFGFLLFAKKVGWVSFVTMTKLALTVGLNLLLVPRYGPVGAAITTVLTAQFMFVSVWILSMRALKMPWGKPW